MATANDTTYPPNTPQFKGATVNMPGVTLDVDNLSLAGTAVTATAAELNKGAGVTAGTVTASKAVVVDANKSVDVEQVTTTRSLGGTGVPGAAAVATEITKTVSSLADTVATDVLTITVPNTANAAVIEVVALARMGAGGAVGADECVSSYRARVVIVRTVGVNAVGTLIPYELSATNAVTNVNQLVPEVKANVAGAGTIAIVMALSAVTGAVGATNTFTVTAALTRSGAGATNHKVTLFARILNANAAGVTLA